MERSSILAGSLKDMVQNTNPFIDDIYKTAHSTWRHRWKDIWRRRQAFLMFFYCPGTTRSKVIEALKKFGGQAKRYEFTSKEIIDLDDIGTGELASGKLAS